MVLTDVATGSRSRSREVGRPRRDEAADLARTRPAAGARLAEVELVEWTLVEECKGRAG